MGTYYQLYLANYPILDWKGDIEPIILTIFRDSDKRIYERKVSQRNRYAWTDIENDDRTELAYEYTSTVKYIKQRLDVMGFSLARAKLEFVNTIQEELENVNGQKARRWGFDQGFLESTSFDDWLLALHTIYELKLLPWRRSIVLDDPIIRHLVEDGFEGAFPCNDWRSFLRVFLEVCPDDELVVLDITDLLENGYYDSDDALCASAIQQISQEAAPSQKIIVLTEGSTDVYILEQSLKILYPHLAGYYSFMDFGGSNVAGGASFLVSAVKAFIGSGIGNRVICLFDNDTAAHVAMKGLARTIIPDNIKVMNYPDQELAKQYPTIGPGGLVEQDINGSACSIELYLGLDILTQNGNLVPVQWKGYDESLHCYQGEIMNKQQLHTAFRDKVEKCSTDPTMITKTDWDEIKLIFRAIFGAFTCE